MFQRASHVDHFSMPASKMNILCISEMFERSAGLLTGLDSLVDRPSTNKLVGGFTGMGKNINVQQDTPIILWLGGPVQAYYPQKFPGWFHV